MSSLFRDMGKSLRHPAFWALASWLDVVVKYRQSRLGVLWLLAPALVYTYGLGSFFATMMGMSIRNFAGYVAVGWLVFRVLQSVIIESTSAFPSAASFILDGHVRLTDFVLQVAAKAMFYFLTSLPVAAFALAMHPDLQFGGVLLAFLSLPLILINALWIGVVFSLIGARFPDLNQFIGNVFMFAFLFTPIIWHADTVPAGSIRGALMRFNPLFHMVEVVRAPMLGDVVEVSTLYYLGIMTVCGWIAAALAYRRYARFVPIWI